MTRPANCRVRENESKGHGYSLIAVWEKSQMRAAGKLAVYDLSTAKLYGLAGSWRKQALRLAEAQARGIGK
jgi:hypothetical protein